MTVDSSVPISPLLKLPAELRNRIYHQVLANRISTIDSTYSLPGLLTTCRQTFTEACAMYYALTTFRCLTEDVTVAWLTSLPATCLRLIPEIQYDVRWIILHTWVMPMPETECYMFQRLLRRLTAERVQLVDGVIKVNFYDWTGRIRDGSTNVWTDRPGLVSSVLA